jgi:hypothetical protein
VVRRESRCRLPRSPGESATSVVWCESTKHDSSHHYGWARLSNFSRFACFSRRTSIIVAVAGSTIPVRSTSRHGVTDAVELWPPTTGPPRRMISDAKAGPLGFSRWRLATQTRRTQGRRGH